MKKTILRHYRRLFGKSRRKRAFILFLLASILLVLLALGVLGGIFGPALLFWVEGLWNLETSDGGYYLRSSLIAAGAVLLAAFLPAVFFIRRNRIADKQLENTQKQLENTQLSLQEKRYKEGIERLDHESQFVRIGGLYELHQLAEDFPEKWALRVLELTCIFIRTPPRDKGGAEANPDKDKVEGSGKKQLRRDVEEAVHLLGVRGRARREEENREQEQAEKDRKGKSPGGGKLDFRGADLAGGRWEDVDLGGARFFDARLEGAMFFRARLEGAVFFDARLEGARFFEARLEGADFRKARLEGVVFEGGTLTNADFEGARLEGADFRKARLEGADFSDATLEGADFSDARLEGADFSDATLEGATLTDAVFERATLTGADLEGGTLTGADFEGATFTDANFSGADITGADLKDADLSGVILMVRRAFMEGNKSSLVRGATREQLEEGWIEEGRPPVKVEEDRDERTTTTLTEANWRELGLDSPPNFPRDPSIPF